MSTETAGGRGGSWQALPAILVFLAVVALVGLPPVVALGAEAPARIVFEDHGFVLTPPPGWRIVDDPKQQGVTTSMVGNDEVLSVYGPYPGMTPGRLLNVAASEEFGLRPGSWRGVVFRTVPRGQGTAMRLELFRRDSARLPGVWLEAFAAGGRSWLLVLEHDHLEPKERPLLDDFLDAFELLDGPVDPLPDPSADSPRLYGPELFSQSWSVRNGRWQRPEWGVAWEAPEDGEWRVLSARENFTHGVADMGAVDPVRDLRLGLFLYAPSDAPLSGSVWDGDLAPGDPRRYLAVAVRLMRNATPEPARVDDGPDAPPFSEDASMPSVVRSRGGAPPPPPTKKTKKTKKTKVDEAGYPMIAMSAAEWVHAPLRPTRVKRIRIDGRPGLRWQTDQQRDSLFIATVRWDGRTLVVVVVGPSSPGSQRAAMRVLRGVRLEAARTSWRTGLDYRNDLLGVSSSACWISQRLALHGARSLERTGEPGQRDRVQQAGRSVLRPRRGGAWAAPGRGRSRGRRESTSRGPGSPLAGERLSISGLEQRAGHDAAGLVGLEPEPVRGAGGDGAPERVRTRRRPPGYGPVTRANLRQTVTS